MKIFYEGRFRNVSEIESDHIHLDDGIVIRNVEIIKLPFGINISKFSQKKQTKKLKDLLKIINKMKNLKVDNLN